jgi:hypothetical protein
MTTRDDTEQETHASDLLGAASQAWEELLRQRGSYQASLRTIGVQLDANHAFHANVVEVLDGFQVRHERSSHDRELVSRHVGYAEVISLANELEPKHWRWGLGSGEKHGVGRYEVTLRALGIELDAAHAYSLLIDEVDDGFLVTYQYLKPSQGFMVRKRMIFLDVDSVERVLAVGRNRRTDKGGFLAFLAD